MITQTDNIIRHLRKKCKFGKIGTRFDHKIPQSATLTAPFTREPIFKKMEPIFKKMSLSCRARGTAVGGGGIKNKTAPLAHKRSRKTVILFTKEEHRGSDQILSGVVGKVVQEQPNAAVKPATEIGIAENRVRNGKERGADGH